MEKEIVNRVANSPLVTIDLEELYLPGERLLLDIAPWLEEGLVLREKPFRESVDQLELDLYENAHVAVYCSTDAIIPAWAYMYVTQKLTPVVETVVLGTLEDLEFYLFAEIIQSLDITPFENKPVIIKGCANKPIPHNAYVSLTQKLMGVAKSIMYGEACSSVPIYKRKK